MSAENSKFPHFQVFPLNVINDNAVLFGLSSSLVYLNLEIDTS